MVRDTMLILSWSFPKTREKGLWLVTHKDTQYFVVNERDEIQFDLKSYFWFELK